MEQEEINEMVETIEEPVMESVEQSEQKHETLFGFVNCKMLNVRETPDIESEVLTVIHKNSEVMIDPSMSTDEFYSVCTETGIEGFCMRDFIEV